MDLGQAREKEMQKLRKKSRKNWRKLREQFPLEEVWEPKVPEKHIDHFHIGQDGQKYFCSCARN